VREVRFEEFVAAQARGAVVVDVREGHEYAAGHVPGAQWMPLAAVPQHARELPQGQQVYVICATGNRSLAAADWMARAGIDAWSVAGGTSQWARSGHPLARGTTAA
jgi:rhodanese-related sulfurtransferase